MKDESVLMIVSDFKVNSAENLTAVARHLDHTKRCTVFCHSRLSSVKIFATSNFTLCLVLRAFKAVCTTPRTVKN